MRDGHVLGDVKDSLFLIIRASSQLEWLAGCQSCALELPQIAAKKEKEKEKKLLPPQIFHNRLPDITGRDVPSADQALCRHPI